MGICLENRIYFENMFKVFFKGFLLISSRKDLKHEKKKHYLFNKLHFCMRNKTRKLGHVWYLFSK